MIDDNGDNHDIENLKYNDVDARRQERRASRDSEKGREGEVNGEEEDRKGIKKKKEEKEEEEEGGKSIDYTVISGSPGNKQQFLEDQVRISKCLL